MRKPFLKNRGMLWGAALAVVLIVFLTVYITGKNVVERKFDGSRTGNSDGYYLNFELMNMKDSQTLKLASGEELHCTWTLDKGTADILIADADGEAVYRGDGAAGNADFILTVPQDGEYTVTVAGHMAKGRIEITRVDPAG